MATEFNFKSQIATSREQSEKLLALGLKPETADCVLFRRSKNAEWEISSTRYIDWVEVIAPAMGYSLGDFIPAWSLHRLIEICDTNPHVIYTNDAYWGVIDRIEEYIKEGFIDARYMNEGYLEEE